MRDNKSTSNLHRNVRKKSVLPRISQLESCINPNGAWPNQSVWVSPRSKCQTLKDPQEFKRLNHSEILAIRLRWQTDLAALPEKISSRDIPEVFVETTYMMYWYDLFKKRSSRGNLDNCRDKIRSIVSQKSVVNTWIQSYGQRSSALNNDQSWQYGDR